MQKMTKGTIDDFDKYQGQQIKKYTLTNRHGVRVSVISLGSTLYELSVPTADGHSRNLVLNYQHSADYLANPFYVCMAIGRVAGRIADGRLVIDGKTTQLPQNEGKTTLHGGPYGLNTCIWNGQIAEINGQDVIVMSHHQKSSDDGFPGNMDLRIIYSLDADDVVAIKFITKADVNSVFNPTQHTYFNLGNTNTINNHLLKLNAARVLKLDDEKIPTDYQINVAGTPFDFRSPKFLGDGIAEMQNTREKGFDDVFAVQPDGHHMIAELSDPASHTTVRIESERDGMIMFTANSFTKDNMNFVRTNGVGNPYLGVALEPMFLAKPRSQHDFSEMEVDQDKKTAYTIKYHLSY